MGVRVRTFTDVGSDLPAELVSMRSHGAYSLPERSAYLPVSHEYDDSSLSERINAGQIDFDSSLNEMVDADEDDLDYLLNLDSLRGHDGGDLDDESLRRRTSIIKSLDNQF